MIIKTTAIALRIESFSRTSQVIAWLTPTLGRVVTLAKGAKRRQSDHLGQYDLYYTCEILFYANTRGSLHILKECCPLETRLRLRSDWRACAGASYVADLVNRLTPSDTPHERLFRLTEVILDFLSREGISQPVIHWAELRCLEHLGVGPHLTACLSCGAHNNADRGMFFAPARGGLICSSCRSDRDNWILPVGGDTLAMLRTWEKAATPRIALRTVCSEIQAETAQRLLGAFLEYHLEIPLLSRDIALGML